MGHDGPAAGKDDLKCDVCDRTFDRRSRLIAHYKTHTGERPYTCPFCSKRFASKGNCNTHVRVHTRERPYVCRHCDRRFSQHGQMVIHVRQHTGEKPYVCPHCKKGFTCSKVLKIHVRTHTGEKPYVCDFCSKGFAAYANLVVHRRIHTRERPYSCKLCGRAFEHSGNLVRHERGHHVDGGIRCIPCGRLFDETSQLPEHMTKCHPYDTNKDDVEDSTVDTTTTTEGSEMSPDTATHGNSTRKSIMSTEANSREGTLYITAAHLTRVISTRKEEKREKSPDSGCATVSDEDDNLKESEPTKKSFEGYILNCGDMKSIQDKPSHMLLNNSNLIPIKRACPDIERSFIEAPTRKRTNMIYARHHWDKEHRKGYNLKPIAIQNRKVNQVITYSNENAPMNESCDLLLSRQEAVLQSVTSELTNCETTRTSISTIPNLISTSTLSKYSPQTISNPLNLSRDILPSFPREPNNVQDSRINITGESMQCLVSTTQSSIQPKIEVPSQWSCSKLETPPVSQSILKLNNDVINSYAISRLSSASPRTVPSHFNIPPRHHSYSSTIDPLIDPSNNFTISKDKTNLESRVDPSQSLTCFSNLRDSIRRSVLALLPPPSDRPHFKKNVADAVGALLGDSIINQLGYPDKSVDQVLVTVLDMVGATPCADVRVDENDRLRVNMRQLLEYAFPETQAWQALGWVHQPIEVITQQIVMWARRSCCPEQDGQKGEAGKGEQDLTNENINLRLRRDDYANRFVTIKR